VLSDLERTDWAAAELRMRLGHHTGAFPLERLPSAMRVAIVRVGEIGASFVWNQPDRAVVAVDDKLNDPDARMEIARGVGTAALYLGWLTGAPVIPFRDEETADAQANLFALRLLAPFEAIATFALELATPERIALELGVPLHVAERQLAGYFARAEHHSRITLGGNLAVTPRIATVSPPLQQ
jgi:hypothetical protein